MLCVIESSLRELHKLRPHIADPIDFCSDAGSRYKSSQTILGLRYAKEVTGIRVRRLHFNASGEGKGSEIDGHNTDIKSRRESTMRAGGPPWCVTPETEAQAQLHSDGIPGSYPVVLDFDYENQVESRALGRNSVVSRLSSTRERGRDSTEIIGNRSSKRFTKEELDKKYCRVNEESRELQGANFPQGEKERHSKRFSRRKVSFRSLNGRRHVSANVLQKKTRR
jgi:hypothetical protein